MPSGNEVYKSHFFPKAQRRLAIRTLLDAAAYLVGRNAKAGSLPLSEFLAYVILIEAAYNLGYRGRLIQFDKVKL